MTRSISTARQRAGASLAALLVLSVGVGACDGGSNGDSNAGEGGSGGSPGSSTGGGDASGGTSAGGSNASGGQSASGGSNSGVEPRPSAGCGKANPTVGERTLEVQGEAGPFIVSIPASYDPNVPLPLGFAFHGYGRTHSDCRATDCKNFQSVMQGEAILVYMKSFSDGWEQSAVRDKNAAFFEGVLDRIEDEFCVDERRVFVAGTSSGASFTNVLACRYGDRLLAAIPVAGSLPENEGCQGHPALALIHGIDDPHVTFASGEEARDFFVERNGCETTTVPELSTVHAEIRASRDASETNQKCVDYQGCDPGRPVRWCEHSEGGYDDSTHGWPTAGGQMIWDFVQTL